MGGTIERLAARVSLQRPYNDQIMTPRQLYNWARIALPVAHFGYCTTQEYIQVQQKLESRFVASCTIPGTRKLHSFIPISSESFKIGCYSTSVAFKEISLAKESTVQEHISGFVTCVFGPEW